MNMILMIQYGSLATYTIMLFIGEYEHFLGERMWTGVRSLEQWHNVTVSLENNSENAYFAFEQFLRTCPTADLHKAHLSQSNSPFIKKSHGFGWSPIWDAIQ